MSSFHDAHRPEVALPRPTPAGRQAHSTVCWCLNDSAECCRPNCTCHDESEFAPSTPFERIGWSITDVTNAWRDLCLAVGITGDEFHRFHQLLTIRHRQGSALLARHRRRRHR